LQYGEYFLQKGATPQSIAPSEVLVITGIPEWENDWHIDCSFLQTDGDLATDSTQ